VAVVVVVVVDDDDDVDDDVLVEKGVQLPWRTAIESGCVDGQFGSSDARLCSHGSSGVN
jgi:hypothetical protein